MSTNEDKPGEKTSGKTPGEKPENPEVAAEAATASDTESSSETVAREKTEAADKAKAAGTAKSTDKAEAAGKAEDAEAGSAAGEANAEPKKKGRALPWLAAASVVILAAGIAGVVWKGIEYSHARQEQHMSEVRDQVLDVASQVVINSMSFTKDTVEQDQQRLREDSTGAFLAQQDEYADQIKQKITEQSATTKAEVSNAALTAVDDDLGTATVVLIYTASSERKDMPGVSGRQAARVELQREDDRWKVADLVPVGVQVPVGDSSQSVQELNGAQSGAQGSGADQGSGASAAPSSAAKSSGAPASSAAPTSSKAPASSTAKSGGN